MSSAGSVTHWIRLLKDGDEEGAERLWQRDFEKLMRLARKRLWGARRQAADEEDVALSAFHSFCRAAAKGRFPRMEGRDDLWRLLLVITARKAIDLVHRERREKVRGQSARSGLHRTAEDVAIEQVVGNEPTPEFAALVAEQCQRLLDRLGDAELRSVALWKMDGCTNAEIAAKLCRAEGTVERKLRLIRGLWQREVTP